MTINNFIIFWIIIMVILMISNRNMFYLSILKRKKERNREGRKRNMPAELIKEFIGKVCAIMMFNESFGVTGKIVAVEDNWIKVEEKNNKIRLINGDMIRDITIMPEKYQK